MSHEQPRSQGSETDIDGIISYQLKIRVLMLMSRDTQFGDERDRNEVALLISPEGSRAPIFNLLSLIDSTKRRKVNYVKVSCIVIV